MDRHPFTAQLTEQVVAMLETSGTLAGFDAAAWVKDWLENPLPALGGQCPEELIGTREGQEIVARLVARIASGAFA